MTAPTTSALAFPGDALAVRLANGGWIKRAKVSPSRLPRLAGEQRPCPTNGHLDRPAPHRGLHCTNHQPGWHAAVSLGHVLAMWRDRTAAARVNQEQDERKAPDLMAALRASLEDARAERESRTAAARVATVRADEGGA